MKSPNKTLRILELFLESQNSETSLSELTKLSGFKKTTVKHNLDILKDHGYLRQSQERGKYSIGFQLIHMGNIIKYKINVREIALPFLLKLGKSVGELVTLINWDGTHTYLAEEIQSNHFVRTVRDPSSLIPLYCSAVGKIILADMTEQEVEHYFQNEKIQAFTTNTITDLNMLKSHLKMVSKENIAYDDLEYLLESRQVAAGIRNAEGKYVSVVSVTGPSVRLTRSRMIEIAPEVRHCAEEISAALGYKELVDKAVMSGKSAKK